MRSPARIVIVIIVILAAALSFHEVSGRVLDWLKAMHGGAGQTIHGSK